jgi:hypothetical protein
VGGLLGLLERPGFRRGLFVLAVALLALPLDWAGAARRWTGVDPPAWPAALAGAALVAAVAYANLAALARLPFPVQVPLVWAELGLLFLAFCLSFRLDLAFILARLPGLLGFGGGGSGVPRKKEM